MWSEVCVAASFSLRKFRFVIASDSEAIPFLINKG
jgi:hypothetical protein